MKLSHVAWNLGGLDFPLGIAVLTVPHSIENLGQERFGLLALAWGLIGYAGSLDLGLGRALTQMVARLRGEENLLSIPDVLATAGQITLVTGLIGGALIGVAVLTGGQANLLAATAQSPDAVNQVYNVAVGDRTSLNELYAQLHRNLPPRYPHLQGAQPVHRDFRVGDVSHSLIDIGKAQRLLGYASTQRIGDGLALAMPWYIGQQ